MNVVSPWRWMAPRAEPPVVMAGPPLDTSGIAYADVRAVPLDEYEQAILRILDGDPSKAKPQGVIRA